MVRLDVFADDESGNKGKLTGGETMEAINADGALGGGKLWTACDEGVVVCDR